MCAALLPRVDVGDDAVLHGQLGLEVATLDPLDALAGPDVEGNSAALCLHHLQIILYKLLHLGHVHVARRRLAEKKGNKKLIK